MSRVGRALRLEAFLSHAFPMWIALCAVLGAAVLGRVHFDIPWKHMMADPAVAAGGPFYLGFVSNVGALLWAALASIFLFSAWLHRASGGDADERRFLLCSGLFGGLLGLDDVFMLHDEVLADYQFLLVGSYGVVAALYAARFASILSRTAYPLLAAAVLMLGASAALDQLEDLFSLSLADGGFVEDGAKLFGIGTWLSYGLHTCSAMLKGERQYGGRSAESAAPLQAWPRAKAGLSTARERDDERPRIVQAQ